MLKYIQEEININNYYEYGFCFALINILKYQHKSDIRYNLYRNYDEKAKRKSFIFKELYAYKPKVFYETDYSWSPVDNPETKSKEGSTIRINILKEIIAKMEKENEENKLKRRNRKA